MNEKKIFVKRNGKVVVEYTEIEQKFWQAWGDYWSRSKDCDEASIASGISPYCRFRDWLNRTHPPIGIETLESCMKDLAETFQRYPPKLAMLKMRYDQKTKRARITAETKNRPPRENCSECDGTGLVHVVSLREIGFKPRPIFHPRKVVPGSTFAHRPVPCRCSTGDMMNQRIYGYADRLRDQLFRARVTSTRYVEISRECNRMSGVEAAERVVAADPERSVRSLPGASQAMDQRKTLMTEYPDVANEMRQGREPVQTAAAIVDAHKWAGHDLPDDDEF